MTSFSLMGAQIAAMNDLGRREKEDRMKIAAERATWGSSENEQQPSSEKNLMDIHDDGEGESKKPK
jgi:hypothetical protein